MNDKRCLISFASKGREDYNKAMTRNIIEARKHYDGDMLYYSLDNGWRTVEDVEIKQGLPVACPPHSQVPYGFKPYLFKEAYDKGYRQILWLDSTIVVSRDLAPIFKEMKKRGVIAFHNLGHDLNKWISDIAAKNLDLDLSKPIPQTMACCMGFDLDHSDGKRIFDKWYEMAQDGESFQNNPGSFPGHVSHRHDQSIISGLLSKEPIKMLPYGSLVYQPHDTNGEFGNDFYFVNKGVS